MATKTSWKKPILNTKNRLKSDSDQNGGLIQEWNSWKGTYAEDDFFYTDPAEEEQSWQAVDSCHTANEVISLSDPCESMSDAELEQKAQQILSQVFGYHSFRGPQRDIILHLARGGSAIVLMPTGGGKSLCYQIPALMRSGVALVVSPLIALMQDQVDALVGNGVRAAFLNSSLTAQEARRICAKIYSGQLDLLYVSPERAIMDGFLEMLGSSRLALIAIDEAHCVSQWGHDFRPEYVQLAKLREHFPGVPWIALTATADEATRGDIINHLGLQEAKRFITSFDRPNIYYSICAQASGMAETRRRFLAFLQNKHRGDSGIIYCLTRKDVEKTAQWLCDLGYDALPYHAGMSNEERAANQTRFVQEEAIIMVATVAFGMGIDKPNVRFVAHFCLPSSVEAYYQETGRAGRDGLPSSAWLSYNMSDIVMRQSFIENSSADDLHKNIEKRKLRALLGFCETVSCRRRALLEYFGEEAKEHCGYCDNCTHPPHSVDGLVYAQKALSCVYRTGQLYGAAYLIDVLRGAKTERLLAQGHDKLSTYSIGKELSVKQWTSVFRQLMAAGYLKVDLAGYGSIKLTKRSRDVLEGKIKLPLRIDEEIKASSLKKEAKLAKRPVLNTLTERCDGQQEARSVSELFEVLRRKRMELARREGIAPYLVLHDASLLAMAQQRPRTLEELSKISGFGVVKLQKYGPSMLSVIAEFLAEERSAS